MKTYEVVIQSRWGSVTVDVTLPAGTPSMDVIREAERQYQIELNSASSFILREH
jgi:hypothetical protein